MKITSLLLLIPAVCFLVSCEKHATEHSHGEGHSHSEAHAHADHAEGASASKPDGEKWPVNPEMKPFVAQGQKLVQEFVAKGDSDFLGLSAALKEQNQGLIKSCTMSGPAHDALHDWLVPQMERVTALAQTRNSDEAAKIVSALNQAYSDYGQHFE